MRREEFRDCEYESFVGLIRDMCDLLWEQMRSGDYVLRSDDMQSVRVALVNTSGGLCILPRLESRSTLGPVFYVNVVIRSPLTASRPHNPLPKQQ